MDKFDRILSSVTDFHLGLRITLDDKRIAFGVLEALDFEVNVEVGPRGAQASTWSRGHRR